MLEIMETKFPKLIVLLLALGISACAGIRQESRQAYRGTTLPFSGKDVQGWRYDLVSSDRIFSIRFEAGGNAFATIGSGNVLAAPGYRWEIDHDGRLSISDEEGPRAVYQLLSLSRNTVTVWDQTGGHTDVFTRVQNRGVSP